MASNRVSPVPCALRMTSRLLLASVATALGATGAAAATGQPVLVAGRALDTGPALMLWRDAGAGEARAPHGSAEIVLAQATEAPAGQPQTVGKPPEERRLTIEDLGALQAGGVLTPKGMLVVEPSFTYSQSGVNRFTFRGSEIVETVLIGVVEAEDADRDFYEAALTLRYGVTNRLEVEARIPGVYRDDRVGTTANLAGTDVEFEESLDGSGLGDIEAAVHYQINQGGAGIPYVVANLRAKFPTGRGPFDVDRDPFGIETELPTGSGFYSIEPSLTFIYPSDPVVLFANIGYLFNLERDVDKTIGGQEIGEVDPGDSIRFGFGFSFAVNESMSFSLGYSQDLIQKTETEVNGVTTKAEKLTVGSISIGVAHRLTDWMSIDVGTSFGVTSDAPDVSLGVRLPIRLQLF
jgi:opacity protein-like surface antigen